MTIGTSSSILMRNVVSFEYDHELVVARILKFARTPVVYIRSLLAVAYICASQMLQFVVRLQLQFSFLRVQLYSYMCDG